MVGSPAGHGDARTICRGRRFISCTTWLRTEATTTTRVAPRSIRRSGAGTRDHRPHPVPAGLRGSGDQYRRALKPAMAQIVERLIGASRGIGRGLGPHTGLWNERQEFHRAHPDLSKARLRQSALLSAKRRAGLPKDHCADRIG